MAEYRAIAESKNYIVLDKYTRQEQIAEGYQSEGDLERELIQDLSNQGYEYLPALTTPDAMMVNVRKQLQALNKVEFTDAEWARFCEQYLNTPSDNILDKTRKVHSDYIFDFVFDDGHIENIYLFDKKTIARNKVQVIKQFEQTGSHANRYDVTILVNGLPLVQIELKRRGLELKEAFNQINRYQRHSYWAEDGLFQYVQVFVISNGANTKYYANNRKQSFKQTFSSSLI